MKKTGIVRKIDELGRVTLPIEIRRNLGIEEKDPIEIFLESGSVILKKHQDESGVSNTGIVRKIDELGRVTLPIEIRRMLDIEEKDPIEIFIEDSALLLKKHSASCVFCGSSSDVVSFGGKYICGNCVAAIKNI